MDWGHTEGPQQIKESWLLGRKDRRRQEERLWGFSGRERENGVGKESPIPASFCGFLLPLILIIPSPPPASLKFPPKAKQEPCFSQDGYHKKIEDYPC